MSSKRKVYTAGFKAKIVLEAEYTLNEHPKGITSLWSGHGQ